MSGETPRKDRDLTRANAQDVVGLVDDLLNQAIESGASDIHFEPTKGQLDVRFRLDGVLSSVESLPAALSDNVVARLKVLAEEALPDKQQRFQQYLTDSSDQGVSQLLATIEGEVERIEERLEDLNNTLRR
ncbi:MAG: ATPase, T2SS/T4P/T4SS family, partial [Planctomycetota bacterium]|nr:ATPase, T2SS/T4P/T4SS family [Planctomycetota bacterium]